MPDAALKQYAQMHKDDPYTVSLAIAESNRRKEIRAGAAQQQQQPSVADMEISNIDEGQAPEQNALPEEQGIGALPAPNMQGMAGGGIVAFKDGKEVKAAPSFDTALDMEGVTDPIRRAFLKAIYSKETGSGTNTTTSNRGAVGQMQILPATFKSVASPGMKIDNALDNMRAGIRYASQGYKLAGGDPRLAGAYYYGGPGGLNKARKGIAVSDPKNPSYPTTLEYGDDIAKRMASFKPITGQMAAAPAVGNSIISSANAGQPSQEARLTTQDSLLQNEQMVPTKATILGVIQSLGKAEAIKRFGVGLVEDSLIGTVGMPADLRKASATSGIPFLRAMEALTTAVSPNVSKDKFTTEGLKKSATAAGVRPEDSPDPNIRAIQTAGEFTGYLTNPVAGVRKLIGGAQKGIAGLKSGVGSWMDELNGVKPVDALADAKAAQAAAEAKIAAPRLEAPARAAPTSPLVPPLQTQAPSFPVSAEARAAKEAAAAQAAARAAARATEKPQGLGALAADKLAAKAAGNRVAVLESAAAREAAGGSAAAKEAAALKEAAAAKEARNVIASPLEAAPRLVGKDASNLPTTLGGETTEDQAVPVDVPYDIGRERDNLQRRYPITERAEPAPQQDDMAREIASLLNRYPAPTESPKEIIDIAKEATPKSAATKGFTNEDWLNLGFGLLAGKSSSALENLGTAGLGTLAARREREKEERTAALTQAINTPEAERIINRLMQEKGIDYESALELYYKNKNYIDTRMYGYNRAAEAKQAAAETGAGARTTVADTVAGSKSDKLQQERLALYLEQMEALRKSSAYLLKQSNPVAYNEQLEIINKRFPEFAGQGGGASSALPNAKIVNVRPQ